MIDWTKNREQKNTFFQRKVDVNDRKAMIHFLENHFKYALSGRNYYAHNIKIYQLPFTEKEKDVLFAMVDAEDAYLTGLEIMREWEKHVSDMEWAFKVYGAGRSGGYLYLTCETDRHFFEVDDWDVECSDASIADIVRAVQEFDELMDTLLEHWKDMANKFEVVEEEVITVDKVKRIREKEAV